MSDQPDAWLPFESVERYGLPPWLAESWQSLFERHQQQRMPHALMLQGPDGIGKRVLADWIAATLLCEQASVDGPCGQCASCQRVRAGTHPDRRGVFAESTESPIKIDTVRALNDWLQLTPQYDAYKVALITPAEAMNKAAANSLLKTLEEPASNVLLILLCRISGAIPATIASRCQRTVLTIGDKAGAQRWLADRGVGEADADSAITAGSPLKLLDEGTGTEAGQLAFDSLCSIIEGKASIARTVTELEKRSDELSLHRCLEIMQSCVADIIRLKSQATVEEPLAITHAGQIQRLKALSTRLNFEDWFAIYDQFSRLYLLEGQSFRLQAVLEGVFADIRLKQSH